MLSRYFVTFEDQQQQRSTTSLGLFPDQEAAEFAAQLNYSAPAYSVEEVRPETSAEVSLRRGGRFFIRSARIAVGLALGMVCIAWLQEAAPGTADVSIGQLTLRMIGANILYTIECALAFWACWWIAFGDAPSPH